ncbi:hypothetical protein AvCA_30650 [Azotobacter vinelandii CA]|uniref:Lysozyme inhibitor LprI-like N-terminal domain-containing protein n=2 Tax=Azotobacter vinelandii TaxID=354 RepID=C1DN63_AZOVD|nr:lysozyme inhibitor LprI family protein [Azotobacter vinelandii]ACO79230.1 Conserved hypothetical protein DUF1311 [Azotobacter vinelandii DJ]AGK14765.1 hypothetical protein AvCA_30650 [Azotobacter vinelandii CA]AGK21049.1 hypothetical protein AvCA6_30650 [Azotobacter vinelandii CA6]SFX96128.1 Uncharacterized conserved protein YecT, DUF1311 family [Azotobacter vinelandii]GLK61157.1 hypothetical protein GCM10017624_33200 [Azotobacter vinelandii]
MKSLPPALALLAIATLAQAQEPTYNPAYAACMDKAGGVTAGMIDCIGTELATQDRRLNAAYRTLGQNLTPERRQRLQRTQRLWLQYRDANCDFYADPDGGSLARVAANECVLRETTERAAELERLR